MLANTKIFSTKFCICCVVNT